MVLSADIATPVDFIFLDDGPYRIDIDYPTGVTGTVTPRQTVDGTVLKPVLDCSDAAIVITGSGQFGLYGPVRLGFIVASITGSVTIYASKIPPK